jgi:hypothetical protein
VTWIDNEYTDFNLQGPESAEQCNLTEFTKYKAGEKDKVPNDLRKSVFLQPSSRIKGYFSFETHHHAGI